MPKDHLRIGIAAVLAPDQAQRIVDADERFEVNYDQELLPPRRFASDTEGDNAGWKRTPEQQARYEELCTNAEALFGLPDTSPKSLRAVVEKAPDLIWVHTMAAGGGSQVRAADLAQEDLDRIEFTTSAGVHADPLAEYAVFGVLCGVKELDKFQELQVRKEWAMRWPIRQVADMTVMVVGMGNIGRTVAKRFLDLGATVIGVARSAHEAGNVKMYTSDRIVEAAAQADALINCLPGAVGTEGLISAEVLAAVRPNCVIVSLGRGNCIDEQAMIAGLQLGHLRFAALDVTASEPLAVTSPLWEMKNVLISPHAMALSDKESDRIVDLFIANAKALLDGRPMLNVVNKQYFY